MKRLLFNFNRWGVIILLSSFTMGNQGCDPQLNQRQLRKRVSLGHIQAGQVSLPNGQIFNFEYVVNAQMRDILANSPDFVLERASQLSAADLTVHDLNSLNSWVGAGAFLSDNNFKAFDVSGETPECLLERPQLRIDGYVEAFELEGSGGVCIGYGPGGVVPPGSTAGCVTIAFARMTMGLSGFNEISNKLLASGRSSAQTYEVNAKIDFGTWLISPNFYYRSSVAQATRNALSKTLSTLNSNLSRVPWESQVLFPNDDNLVVLGGARMGLREGDEFNIHNMEYVWAGEPCHSNYKGSYPVSQAPSAIIKIGELGDDISRGIITEQNAEAIQRGARMTVKTLVPAPLSK